jgi:hypothetical protein
MRTIILNSANSVPQGDDLSVFEYPFPTNATFGDNEQIAVSSISMYYSWFNISASQRNNVFQYRFYNGGGPVIRTVTIPDGFYTASELNDYLQSVFITAGDFAVDGSGNNVYFAQISENSTAYAIQLDCFVIPTAAQAAVLGYTAGPTGGYPVAASTFEFIILANEFQSIIGFNTGTYPPAPTNVVYSAISSFTPQFSPVNTIVLACSLVNNPFATPSNIMYAFSPLAQFGELITPSINSLIWNQVQRGTYQSVRIQFLDQLYRPIPLQDVNLVVQLVFRTVEK